jgi:hypothetical protein
MPKKSLSKKTKLIRFDKNGKKTVSFKRQTTSPSRSSPIKPPIESHPPTDDADFVMQNMEPADDSGYFYDQGRLL